MKTYNQLSTQEKILVNSEIEKRAKSATTAWILWMSFGTIGAHRYYLNKKKSAIVMTILGCSLIGLFITIPWATVDAFFIPRWLKENKKFLEECIINELK